MGARDLPIGRSCDTSHARSLAAPTVVTNMVKALTFETDGHDDANEGAVAGEWC
jgi:hypothetical protein